MESDKRQKKRRSAKAASREADDTSRRIFPTFKRVDIHDFENRWLLYVLDMNYRVIWLNVHAAPDANIVCLQCRKCEKR